MSKAQIGDYVPNSGTYAKVTDILENDGVDIYVLDNGMEIDDSQFSVDDIRLESEVFSG